jgi:choline dehydrogenase-like flavoprotein
MIAHTLVHSGERVLMIERGAWVPRGAHNWDAEATLELTPFYSHEAPYRVWKGRRCEPTGFTMCVGGPSVFYGGVSLRFREADFEPDPGIVQGSGARWPFGYSELEPYYARAEQILKVAGDEGADPTEPRRSSPYPQPAARLSETPARIADAARGLGLHPFRLPVAINYAPADGRGRCIGCPTCDTFACAIEAKNDLATVLLKDLVRKGLHIADRTVARRLLTDSRRVVGVECLDRPTGEVYELRAERFVLSAGGLGSPHLILASGLDRFNSAGDVVGHYLMRHCSAIVFGIFPRRMGPIPFHKQLGLHDFYFGHPWVHKPRGKLGALQQMQTPPQALIRRHARGPRGRIGESLALNCIGLLALAEDQPQAANGVAVDASDLDAFGLPRLVIRHRHSLRDRAARRSLIRQARRILRRAGAVWFHVHAIDTFSHALGTVRMGSDPRTAPLDPNGRFNGLHNLFVADGSVLPTSAAVNPSLTIAANALRVGSYLVHGDNG